MTKSYRDTAMEKNELTEIESLPLADIKGRLEELGLPSSIPTELQRVITRSAPSLEANLLSFIDDPDDDDVECMPLTEVTAHLRELGINYRAGLAEIINLAEQQQAHKANQSLTFPSSGPQRVSAKAPSWVRSIIKLIGSLKCPNRMAIAAIGSACIAVSALIIVGPIRDEVVHKMEVAAPPPPIRAEPSPTMTTRSMATRSPAKAEPAAPAKTETAKAPPSPSPSLSQAALDPAVACGRDELRLARLRADPVPEEVARLQRELSCDKLRAQVQRLFESVATAPPVPPTPAGATATPTTGDAPPAK